MEGVKIVVDGIRFHFLSKLLNPSVRCWCRESPGGCEGWGGAEQLHLGLHHGLGHGDGHLPQHGHTGRRAGHAGGTGMHFFGG